jgi:hypothetical protein
MFFVREVLIGHVAWITPVGNLTDGIDQEIRNAGRGGMIPYLLIGD